MCWLWTRTLQVKYSMIYFNDENHLLLVLHRNLIPIVVGQHLVRQ
jgi:hypothetical protein